MYCPQIQRPNTLRPEKILRFWHYQSVLWEFWWVIPSIPSTLLLSCPKIQRPNTLRPEKILRLRHYQSVLWGFWWVIRSMLSTLLFPYKIQRPNTLRPEKILRLRHYQSVLWGFWWVIPSNLSSFFPPNLPNTLSLLPLLSFIVLYPIKLTFSFPPLLLSLSSPLSLLFFLFLPPKVFWCLLLSYFRFIECFGVRDEEFILSPSIFIRLFEELFRLDCLLCFGGPRCPEEEFRIGGAGKSAIRETKSESLDILDTITREGSKHRSSEQCRSTLSSFRVSTFIIIFFTT